MGSPLFLAPGTSHQASSWRLLAIRGCPKPVRSRISLSEKSKDLLKAGLSVVGESFPDYFEPIRLIDRKPSEMLLSKPTPPSWTRFLATFLLGATSLAAFMGCQQAGSQGGFAGAAPITQLPGQNAVNGPTFPTLGPFGASARVPPPSTGSFQGASAANASFNSNNYAPAGYAPNGIRPMSFDSNQVGQPGQVANVGGFGQVAATGSGVQSSGWQETSANAFSAQGPAAPTDGIRSGGMPVIDLTGAPPPPGYYPPAPSTSQFGPSSFAPNSITPNSGFVNPNQNFNSQNFNSQSNSVSGGGFATSSPSVNPSGFSQPAANQPAFSTADRPIQWQSPRR